MERESTGGRTERSTMGNGARALSTATECGRDLRETPTLGNGTCQKPTVTGFTFGRPEIGMRECGISVLKKGKVPIYSRMETHMSGSISTESQTEKGLTHGQMEPAIQESSKTG